LAAVLFLRVGVSQVGGKFVHKSADGRFDEKSTYELRDSVMNETSPEREAQARELATAIAASAEEELLAIARTLLDADPASLFGATEFQIRDLALKIAAKAYEQRLAQKKRLRSFLRDLPRL
jgi:hypothetical protein